MTRKMKRRFWTLFWRIMVVLIALLLVSITGNQYSIMVNQSDIKMMQTDTLNTLNDIRSIDTDKENRSQVNFEPLNNLGTFTVTHYCSCEKCCGKSDGITATGTKATDGRTIAVDPNIIPLGSEVLIDGQAYIAEDVGGAVKGNKIDIYVNNHQEAVNRGKIVREVFVD